MDPTHASVAGGGWVVYVCACLQGEGSSHLREQDKEVDDSRDFCLPWHFQKEVSDATTIPHS